MAVGQHRTFSHHAFSVRVGLPIGIYSDDIGKHIQAREKRAVSALGVFSETFDAIFSSTISHLQRIRVEPFFQFM